MHLGYADISVGLFMIALYFYKRKVWDVFSHIFFLTLYGVTAVHMIIRGVRHF
jgi:hypothetical protein